MTEKGKTDMEFYVPFPGRGGRKMNKKISVVSILPGILYVLCLFALLTGSRGYLKETPSYLDNVRRIDQVTALTGGEESDISLPHNFSPLAARTPVTLTAEFLVDDSECLYVKSVYAPLKVYVNDILVYTSGQEGSFPKFMDDVPDKPSEIESHSGAGKGR